MIRRLTQPLVEPITLAEIKARLRVTHTDDDAAITAYGKAAREVVEKYTGRYIVESTFRLVCEEWPGSAILLGASPLISVQSVKYWPDEDGAAQETLAGWVPITDTEPGQVLLPSTVPDLSDRPDAVTVDFTAGAAAPEDLRQATIILAAWLYEQGLPVNIGNIVNNLPFHFEHILSSHRIGGYIS